MEHLERERERERIIIVLNVEQLDRQYKIEKLCTASWDDFQHTHTQQEEIYSREKYSLDYTEIFLLSPNRCLFLILISISIYYTCDV